MKLTSTKDDETASPDYAKASSGKRPVSQSSPKASQPLAGASQRKQSKQDKKTKKKIWKSPGKTTLRPTSAKASAGRQARGKLIRPSAKTSVDKSEDRSSGKQAPIKPIRRMNKPKLQIAKKVPLPVSKGKVQEKKTKEETVYAFIDSQNLNLGAEKSGWRLDFKRLRAYLKTKYNVSKAYLFIGHIPDNLELYEFLEKVGYIIIFKPTTKFLKNGKTTYKGNVDAELVLHAMLHLGNYDKAIIASGDGDFYCLIEYLESKGKLLKVITPSDKYSSLIKKYAGSILSLKKIQSKVERKKALRPFDKLKTGLAQNDNKDRGNETKK